jgi:hypothetical protein
MTDLATHCELDHHTSTMPVQQSLRQSRATTYTNILEDNPWADDEARYPSTDEPDSAMETTTTTTTTTRDSTPIPALAEHVTGSRQSDDRRSPVSLAGTSENDHVASMLTTFAPDLRLW